MGELKMGELTNLNLDSYLLSIQVQKVSKCLEPVPFTLSYEPKESNMPRLDAYEKRYYLPAFE